MLVTPTKPQKVKILQTIRSNEESYDKYHSGMESYIINVIPHPEIKDEFDHQKLNLTLESGPSH